MGQFVIRDSTEFNLHGSVETSKMLSYHIISLHTLLTWWETTLYSDFLYNIYMIEHTAFKQTWHIRYHQMRTTNYQI